VTRVFKSAAAKMVRLKGRWNGRQPLMDLVELCRDQHSTEIRDEIFALHGLANDTGRIRTDYFKGASLLTREVLKEQDSGRKMLKHML
jgi:hypothetical protein